MKTYKKIIFFMGLVVALGFLLGSSEKALALATPNDAQACENSLKFISFATIQCSTPKGPVNFLDNNPTDGASNFDYANDASNVFCKNIPDRAETALQRGISREGGNLDPSDAGQPVNVTLNLGVTTNGTDCVRYGGQEGKSTTITDTQGITYLYQFQGNAIVPLTGVSYGSLSKRNAALVGGYNGGNSGLDIMAFTEGDYKNCSAELLIVKTSGGANSALATLYGLNKDSGGFDQGKYPEVFEFLSSSNVTGCGVVILSNTIPPFDQTFGILGTPPKAPPGSGGGGGGGASSAGCFDSGFALSWIACPLLSAASDFTNFLISGFESLLSFTIPQNPTGTDGMAQVKQSWTIFRTLASALLVIVLLIIVISQAIGGTFLDAYSVRKMLPKVVIAVIAMQLSWVLLVWIVQLVDDAGKGIADLMYQPFRGPQQMGLGQLLTHANIGTGSQVAINFVGIVGTLVLGVAALPAMLVLLLTASLGLLVGFVTLILRKLVIILTLVFVPVALVLWVLPGNGTQRLWKMWLDNFTKALLMFPLVVMLVAGGRILAYVAGTQGNGTFLNLLIVFVGFFGPLFIIPKAFKWGGSAMQFAGNMATNATKPIAEKGGAGFKGIGERWQEKRGNAYNLQSNRLSRGIRRIQSGHMVPFSERSRRLTIAAGDKYANERNDEANALVNRSYEKAVANGYKDGNGVFHEPGVDAGKRALVDLAGQDTTNLFRRQKDVANRAARSATRQMLDTSSWIEMQDGVVTSGKNKGKRVSEVAPFRAALVSSPQHYSATTSNRPDMAPDVIDSAEKGTGLKYETVAPGSAEYYRLEEARLGTALKRLTPQQLTSAHYGLFQDIEKVAAGTGSHALPDVFKTKLDDFVKSGTIGQNAVGSLRGGSEPHVDAALARSSTPKTLSSYFP